MIKNLERELPIKGIKDRNMNQKQYNTELWNPALYAIYFKQLEVLKMLLKDFSQNLITSIRLPPKDNNLEYIIPFSSIL
jgi:hypothetical protein